MPAPFACWPDCLAQGLDCLRATTAVTLVPHHRLQAGFIANDLPSLVVGLEDGLACQHPGGVVACSAGGVLLIPAGAAYQMGSTATVVGYQFLTAHDDIACSMLIGTATGGVDWAKGSALGPGGATIRHLLFAAQSTQDEELRQQVVQLACGAIVKSFTDQARFAPGGPNLVARTRSLLEERFLDPDCGVGTLADELGCNADHLGRVFRKSTGTGLRDILVQMRLDHARNLLVNERQTSIAVIAGRSGFRSASRLSEHFMAAYGISPSQFRRFGHTQ